MSSFDTIRYDNYCSDALDDVTSDAACASFSCTSVDQYYGIVLADDYVTFAKEYNNWTCDSSGSGYSLDSPSPSTHEIIVYDISTASNSTISVSATGASVVGSLTINGNYVMWREDGEIKAFDISTSTSSTLLP